MLINATRSEELRVAIANGNQLENYQIQLAASGICRGNIYRGVVANIEPSLNAAFIDFGAARHGFLTSNDIVEAAYHKKPEKGRRPRIEKVLQKGKPVVVQVTKDAVGTKGATLTTNVSLAGRYIVLTPFDGTRGVSRKVEDDSRSKVQERARSLKLPDGFGCIVRTNAVDQPKTALSRDAAALVRLWKRIWKHVESGTKARLLYDDQDLVLQALRDYLDSDMQEVLIDDDEALAKAKAYVKACMPRTKIGVSGYDGRIPLFSRYNLEPQIDAIYRREVGLPSGGSIVVDPTEALTAIDVNSGRATRASSQEETALHTNLEAADAVAQQLRLRDIGGLIVVDFIDMRYQKHRRQVERALTNAMKSDKARVRVGKISNNGLLEINRQRISQALRFRNHEVCPTCQGLGMVQSYDHVGLNLIRRIEARASVGRIDAVKVYLNPAVANVIQNRRRRSLAELEDDHNITIEILAKPELSHGEEEISWSERGGASQTEKRSGSSGSGKPQEANDDSRKRRRRRRRRGRRDDESRNDDVAASNDDDPNSEDNKASAEAKNDERDDDGGGRRRRRRRRRGRRGRDDGDTEVTADSDDDVAAKEKKTKGKKAKEHKTSDDDEQTPRRSRSRRRRGRSKKLETAETKDNAKKARAPEEDTPQKESATSAPPEETADDDKPKRSRRTRRSRTKKIDAAADSKSKTEKGSDDKDKSKADDKKDKPKRSRRKKAETADTESESPKPRRTRRTRKSSDDADKPAAKSKKATTKSKKKDDGDKADSEDKPKRTRRRRTKKVDADASEAPASKKTSSRKRKDDDAKAGKSDDEPKTQKPRRSRSTKKATPEETAKAAESKSADASEDAPRRRRRRTKKLGND